MHLLFTLSGLFSMPSTSDQDPSGWALNDAPSLSAFELPYQDESSDYYLGLMNFGVSSLVESTRHLPPSSSTNVGPSTNATPHLSYLPYTTSTIDQYYDVNSITPQDPAHACMSYGLSGIGPGVPANAYRASPHPWNPPLGTNFLSPQVNCYEPFAHPTADGEIHNNMTGRTTDCTASGQQKPTILTCGWEGCKSKKNHFESEVDLIQHVKTIHVSPGSQRCDEPTIFTCRWEGCKSKRNHFKRKIDLMRHVEKIHVSPGSQVCDECSKPFNRKDNLDAHARRVHS